MPRALRRTISQGSAAMLLAAALALYFLVLPEGEGDTSASAVKSSGVAGAVSPAGTMRPRHAHRLRYAPGRLLVKFAAGTSSEVAEQTVAHAGGEIGVRVGKIGVRVVEVPRAHLHEVLGTLRASENIRYVERDVLLQALDTKPNDPLWPDQWGLVRSGAVRAWDRQRGSPDVVIAVVDTGVDSKHPDLQGALVPGYDFVNNDADPDDDEGHGTAAAGVIAARGDNSQGTTGMCWRCSLMSVKVLDSKGSGPTATVAAGIVWAVDHGARVVNLSLGGSETTRTLADAVAYALGKGVVVVAAAGNEGTSAPSFPAAYPGVISVAATKSDDTLYEWSNRGPWVQVAAPGCNLSTGLGGGFMNFCGTSAAAPLVSGLAGLALSSTPAAPSRAVAQAIELGQTPVTDIRYGRVNAEATLAALGLASPSVPVDSPPAATAAPPSVPPQAASSTRITVTTATLRGVLTRRASVRRYARTVAAGPLKASLSFTGARSLTLALVDGRGKTLRSVSGRSPLRFTRNLQAGTYRLVVSGRVEARFSLVATYRDRPPAVQFSAVDPR